MAKKVVQKRVVTETIAEDGSKKTIIKEHDPNAPKKKEKAPRRKKLTSAQREELLIENFVGLQNAMTNLSIKFGTLTDQIVTLLRVYEESALSFAQGGKVNDKEMLEKINNLLEQNKTIAKGLVLMESKLRGRSNENEVANTPAQPTMPPQNTSNYQPSISQPRSEGQNFQKSRPLPRL